MQTNKVLDNKFHINQPYYKSTPEMVEEMIRLRANGWSYSAIGRKMGRDRTTVIYWVKKANIENAIPTPVTGRKLRTITTKNGLPQRSSPEVETTETQRLKQMSAWGRFVYKVSQERRQKECPHRAMVSGRCWMCGYVNQKLIL